MPNRYNSKNAAHGVSDFHDNNITGNIKVRCYIWQDGALRIEDYYDDDGGLTDGNNHFTSLTEAVDFAKSLFALGHRVKVYNSGSLYAEFGEHIVESYG
jgi:hypothetical protein